VEKWASFDFTAGDDAEIVDYLHQEDLAVQRGEHVASWFPTQHL
jgi:hypothetical protein